MLHPAYRPQLEIRAIAFPPLPHLPTPLWPLSVPIFPTTALLSFGIRTMMLPGVSSAVLNNSLFRVIINMRGRCTFYKDEKALMFH
jgi:hypothetical protein